MNVTTLFAASRSFSSSVLYLWFLATTSALHPGYADGSDEGLSGLRICFLAPATRTIAVPQSGPTRITNLPDEERSIAMS
jgi:hypothetical protein